jgi:hypothetical protein
LALASRVRSCELRETPRRSRLPAMEEALIERDEVVALLFNVSDLADTLAKIERLLGNGYEEEEADEG